MYAPEACAVVHLIPVQLVTWFSSPKAEPISKTTSHPLWHSMLAESSHSSAPFASFFPSNAC